MTDPLIELAARCEAATGGDRDLESAIKLAYASYLFANGATKDAAVKILNGDLYDDPMPYTASIDAAMKLMPDGTMWLVRRHNGRKDYELNGAGKAAFASVWTGDDKSEISSAYAATPALALCAASLRARAHLQRHRE